MNFVKLYFLLFVTGLVCCRSGPGFQIGFINLEEETLIDTDSITVNFTITPYHWIEKGYNLHVLLDRNHFRELKDELSVTYTDLTEGSHVIFAFLCDKNGVSLKTPGSVVFRNFYFKSKINPLIHRNEPILIINQPQKEKFSGDEGFRILFDFLVLNAKLGVNFQLHYNLDGLDFYTKSEKPIWIENAQRIGAHKLEIRLEMLDGKLVDSNPFNSITKKFLVAEK